MESSSRLPAAPGPRGHFLLGTIPEFRADRLGFLVRTARRYGGVARLGRRHVYLVSDPRAIKRVLQDNADSYGRNTRSVAVLRETLGDGLLTITGAPWRRNRMLAQPAFHKQRLAGFVATIGAAAVGLVDRLGARGADGAAFDLVPEMSRIALQILGRCLFERELADDADAVGRALTVVLHHTVEKAQTLFALPSAIPTPKQLRFRAALRALDRVVSALIEERRRAPSDRGDLLSMLLAARDAETGDGLGDRQLRDEVMTLLLAGHETTSMALSWTFYLLSRHPAVRRTLEAELAEVLAGRVPDLADLPRLRYTRMVLEESLRLYPPAWIVMRSADVADELGGYHIPAGAIVLLSPFVVHHDPALWDNPEGFDPERFAPEPAAGPTPEPGTDRRAGGAAARPRYAYFPFGGGPHLCIGAGFAMMEATILLATVAQRLHLDLQPDRPVTVEPLVTLRPSPGVWVSARPRP